ncbi:MAG: hypothetical protein NFCOHLIN_01335 [Gammaproteobacteria bacterium]|nr:hypothetical protein [Gammaproteobacteria bacterium]
MSKPIWRIRAAEGSQLAGEFLEKKMVAIGWGAVGDLPALKDRAAIPLMFLDFDDLVKAVVEYYDKVDIETQRLLSLRKVYWPG